MTLCAIVPCRLADSVCALQYPATLVLQLSFCAETTACFETAVYAMLTPILTLILGYQLEFIFLKTLQRCVVEKKS
jgi:hypothetical protein